MAGYNDTIAAVATARGTGGIAVIRISGQNALETAEKVFAGSRNVCDMAVDTVCFGKILDGETQIDEGVVTVFRAPRSFTGENVAEISCHGGVLVTNRVLEAILKAGARLAMPGEFTKRAFINGKLSLEEAEDVGELINADSSLYLKASLNLLDGSTGKQIKETKEKLEFLLANIFAVIDYPDEDIDELKKDELVSELENAEKILKGLKDSYATGRVIKEGIKTVIAGRPNSGKSQLMNRLSGRDRSIVTDTAGTTRDVVEDTVVIGDLKLNLADTAGIRKTSDEIELIGVRKSLDEIKRADIVLFLMDISSEITSEDREIFELLSTSEVPFIILLNKSDLVPYLSEKDVCAAFGAGTDAVLRVSAITGNGLELLPEMIERVLKGREIDFSKTEMLLNERQFQCILKAHSAVKTGLNNLRSGNSADLIAEDLSEALKGLGELDGSEVSEEIVKSVFKNFCVGK